MDDFSKLQECIQWVRENLSEGTWYFRSNKLVWAFKNEEDLILFTLRWT